MSMLSCQCSKQRKKNIFVYYVVKLIRKRVNGKTVFIPIEKDPQIEFEADFEV